eukprot:9070181-Pyramimonas_sp.AAC.1
MVLTPQGRVSGYRAPIHNVEGIVRTYAYEYRPTSDVGRLKRATSYKDRCSRQQSDSVHGVGVDVGISSTSTDPNRSYPRSASCHTSGRTTTTPAAGEGRRSSVPPLDDMVRAKATHDPLLREMLMEEGKGSVDHTAWAQPKETKYYLFNNGALPPLMLQAK